MIKKLLQKWLGVTYVAERVAEIDLELHPPTEPEEEVIKGYESQ